MVTSSRRRDIFQVDECYRNFCNHSGRSVMHTIQSARYNIYAHAYRVMIKKSTLQSIREPFSSAFVTRTPDHPVCVCVCVCEERIYILYDDGVFVAENQTMTVSFIIIKCVRVFRRPR